MTTPSTFTYLDGLLQGQASLAVAGGTGLTISEDTWGNASPTTPLIVICDQASTVTLPGPGNARTPQTQIIVVKSGTSSYTVDISRNGALINGAATDDQFTGTDTGIYRYNSDGTDWFRELGGGGGGGVSDMQGAYDGGAGIVGTDDLIWDLTGGDVILAADDIELLGTATHANTSTANFRTELVPVSTTSGDVAAAATLLLDVNANSTSTLPSGTDRITTYTVMVSATTNGGIPDFYMGTLSVIWDGAQVQEVSPLMEIREFQSVDYEVTGTAPGSFLNTTAFEFFNNSASKVGAVVTVLAFEQEYLEATP